MTTGAMVRMKASERTLIVAISPNVQGRGACNLLDNEQKAVLTYAIMDFAKRRNMRISLTNCLLGAGDICWGYEAKTTRNRRPAVKLWTRKTA